MQKTEAGVVRVLGHPAGAAAVRGRVGYVTQTRGLYDHLTACENVRYFARIFAAPASRMEETLDAVHLTELADRVVHTLSGGEQARTALATALVACPQILLLDEPTVGLADAWAWTESDVVAHALPLFHVHGLVLGILGPLRRGGTARHLARFSPDAVAAALREDGTVLFGVPTMYRRLADAAEADPAVRDALGRARILVSGSAPLPAAEHVRIERLTGHRVIERYGMTETLMNTAVRAAGDRRAGYVGPPLAGVDLRLVGDDGNVLEAADGETIGEIHVRGPNLFLEYLNRPDATAEAMTVDGWFRTGDLGTVEADGYVRIVGRRATDLIKSGGYRIGAGEIEAALREHPTVDDAAVTGAADPDLGERVVAWIVLRDGARATEEELVDHVAGLLAPHKRPRVVNFVDDLPRNELGKVQKTRLVRH